MVPDPLLNKVEATIYKFNMLGPPCKVVVGISGGPDSTVLLHILYQLREKYNLKIWAAHLNHCIRGEEAKQEQEWVKHFTRELGVPLIYDSINVPFLARKRKIGLEVAAREVRYRFLEDVATKVDADKIALGHTGSDQAETLLMRIIRGSGLNGLSGIPPVREKIIRPLIEIFRWEIEDYCRRHNLPVREDSSNKNLSFLRNSIRFELIPYIIKKYNPAVVEILAQIADILRTDRDFLETAAAKVKNTVIKKRTDKAMVIDAENLSRLHLALQRRVIRQAIKELKGNLEGIEYSHIHQILNLQKSGGTKLVSLPGDIQVFQQYDELVITREKFTPPVFFTNIEVPGKREIPQLNMVFETQLLSEPPVYFPCDPYQAYLDFDKMQKPLFIRSRKEGDKFRPLGMRGKKKLKDFFIDEKVPLFERDRIPLLCSKDHIVWVVGYRIDERFKIDQNTKNILKVKVTFNASSSTDK